MNTAMSVKLDLALTAFARERNAKRAAENATLKLNAAVAELDQEAFFAYATKTHEIIARDELPTAAAIRPLLDSVDHACRILEESR